MRIDAVTISRCAKRLKHLFGQLVLGDKAYAGGTGEGACLLRPIKRGENKYKEDPLNAKSFNRQFSNIRVRIEHVFARLKTWKTLSGLFVYRWERLSEVVRAIAVVHNMKHDESLKLAGATD